MTLEQKTGRRRFIRGSAAVGASAVGISALASVQTASAADDTLAKARKDVQAAFDTAQKKLDELGSSADSATKEAYDSIKSTFDGLLKKLKDLETLPAESDQQLKRAYRDLQHSFSDIDVEIDKVMSSIESAAMDAWHDARSGVREVHQQLDHLLDGL